MKVHGWGRYPIIEAQLLLPKTNSELSSLIQTNEDLIARGLGRSYGDSASNSLIIEMTRFNKCIEFNEVTGVLTCESGVSIEQILQLIVPKGWFMPVTPGTSKVTIGGAIASDVHGKNHHLSGTFSQFILMIKLMLGTGEIVSVSRNCYSDLFRATCGGMGLTGVIVSATIQLKRIKSSQIRQITVKAKCLDELCDKFDFFSSSTYSVAWIDCLAFGKRLGRSLLMLGEHIEDGELDLCESKKIDIPVNMPLIFLNKYTVKAFNFSYYHKSIKKKSVHILKLESYFYPLDKISNWNRLYGQNGFLQYQFVLPSDGGLAGLKKILSVIANSGQGSFLAVLKKFGHANDNYLSFPIEGYTLALDFRMSAHNIKLIGELDAMVVDVGGRSYLTKDALMSEGVFKKTYPSWIEFEEVRAKYGALGKFSSCQSKRLGLQ